MWGGVEVKKASLRRSHLSGKLEDGKKEIE